MAKQFRVGLIGCGGIANRHATVLQRPERTELVAFCDLAQERATPIAEKYGGGARTLEWVLAAGRAGLTGAAVWLGSVHPA